MKNNEKKLLYINTFLIFAFVIISSFSFYFLTNLTATKVMKYIIIIIFFIVIISFSYFLSKYLLVRFFKTNNLLKLLLKDTLHELNIPLSVIKANTQMLSAQQNSEKNFKKFQRINLACDELYKLYEDIDYYIKKETRVDVRETILLDELIENEIDKFKAIYPKVNINFKVSKLTIYVDKRGFSKVLVNLIANALKYNKNDNDINIFTEDYNLIIKDRGVGMNESELFMIFDRYYQGEDKKNGFGIGLSIVKAFCDEYKIFISIESKLNEGTKINLDLDSMI